MVDVAVVGASGYAGGEVLRILLQHPEVHIKEVTSKQHDGQFVFKVHPNLKGFTSLRFVSSSPLDVASKVDLIFLCVPHGTSREVTPKLVETGVRIIDLSADFRLKDPDQYPIWYGWDHPAPDLLGKFVYGLPELHRDEIRKAKNVSVPGCIASSSIYSLSPLARSFRSRMPILVDAKIGSSGSGNKPSSATHFSERYNSIRIYSPAGHRHVAEIEQELSALSGYPMSVSISAHSVNLVRGILTTSSFFPESDVTEQEIWRSYRALYADAPFVRFIMDPNGIFRYPDPKIVVGSNFVDLGFAIDSHINRIVAIGSLDNLIKGTAGNAIQSMNLMLGFDETEGLMASPMRLV